MERRGFGFEKLIVWQKAREAVLVADRLGEAVLAPSAGPVPAARAIRNVHLAQHRGRRRQVWPALQRQFYEMAIGSAGETASNLIILADLEPAARRDAELGVGLYDEVTAMLTTMCRGTPK